jgi:hypothetical protein
MSTGRHSFKHNDAARMIRATVAAGLKVTGITLNGGVVTVVVNEPASSNAAAAAPPNEWDEVETKSK